MNDRILLIDDNEDAVELLQILLQQMGYEVQVAHSGQAGLALADIFQPKVIISDLGMPAMLGFEVAKSLRKHPTLSNSLILALTGWNDDKTKREVIAAGFDKHLIKPVNLTLLETTLSEYFGSLQAHF